MSLPQWRQKRESFGRSFDFENEEVLAQPSRNQSYNKKVSRKGAKPQRILLGAKCSLWLILSLWTKNFGHKEHKGHKGNLKLRCREFLRRA